MFTGLIQAVGRVSAIDRQESSAKLQIKSAEICAQIAQGDSVSVNGTCLTVVAFDKSGFSVDVMVQTLNLTSTGALSVGSPVNLELATRTQDRLGGHIVQGHVDGVATVLQLVPGEKWAQFDITVPEELMKYVVAQGSITLDGVSLTVGSLEDGSNLVTVWLIPETLAKTNLGGKKPGDLVNVEVDILAKYVERLMSKGAIDGK